MILPDFLIKRSIERGDIVIDPYDPSLIQPSSLDVRVDRLFRVFHNSRYAYIDVKKKNKRSVCERGIFAYTVSTEKS